MKRILFCIIFLAATVGIACAQNNDDWKWGGTVRFKPAATIVSLAIEGIEIMADWVPYVTPSIGIPTEIDIAFLDGIMAFGIMGGVEAVPVRHKEKSGLYLTALSGLFFIEQYAIFALKADIGYQLVTDGGFVFTPAIGVKYNGISGVSLDLMLDIGFAYRRY
jgi:hypothetical protein